MYRLNKDNQTEFFYDEGYQILQYDLEYNLQNNKRFNTRFMVVSSTGKNHYRQSLDELIRQLETQKQKYITGYWNDDVSIWIEPGSDPEKQKEIQKKIDAIKLFQNTKAT